MGTGNGNVRVNGCPINTVTPDLLRVKVYEPLLLLGKDKWSKVDIKIRCQGGGFTSQIYAMRQAVAKGIVANPRSLVGALLAHASRSPTVELVLTVGSWNLG